MPNLLLPRHISTLPAALSDQPQSQGLWICGQFAWRRNGQLAVGNDNAVIHRTAL
jgi:hypothetical protein